jgi:ferredoxin-NADP reductase
VLAALSSRSDLGGGLIQLGLTPAAATAQSYVQVGQYTRVTVGGNSALFFLAGTPGAANWTLVLRAHGAVAEHLARAPLGTTVDVSDAQSDGFAWPLIANMNVALLLVGSGFGAVFSILQKRLEERKHAHTVTRVYVGVVQPNDPPAPGFLKAQQALGVEIILCTLDPAAPHAEFPTLQGAMELAFVDSIANSREVWGAIVVGPPALAQALRALQANAPNLKHVLTNT